MSTTALNCLIYGDDPDEVLTVNIPLDDGVTILREMIKEVDAKNILLFRLKMPLSPGDAIHVFYWGSMPIS